MSNKPQPVMSTVGQWWLIYEKGYSTWVSNKPLHSADVDSEVHVLEAAPTLQLLDKLEAALALYEHSPRIIMEKPAKICRS